MTPPIEPELQWQPIDTAPQDGTRVLVVYSTKIGPRVEIGQWTDERHHSRPQPHWTSGLAQIWGVVVARKNPPTHWMPLPSPPQAQQ